MKTADVQKYENQLRDRLRELTGRLKEIENDLDEPVDPDVEERATEREGDEVLESLGNAGLVEMKKIQAALARKTRPLGFVSSVGRRFPRNDLTSYPTLQNANAAPSTSAQRK